MVASSSGSRAVFGGLGRRRRNLRGRCAQIPISLDQAIQIVVVRAVGTKRFLVKQAFDAATQANLVGMLLRTDRPTHSAMPATPEHHHRSGGHSCGHYAQPQQPIRFLVFRAQPATTNHSNKLRICAIGAGCNRGRKSLSGLAQKWYSNRRERAKNDCDSSESLVTYRLQAGCERQLVL